MVIRTVALSLAVLLVIAVVVSQAPIRAESIEHTFRRPNSVLAVLRTDGHYSVFLSALESTGLSETIREHGPYTVFAPTDDAFAKLSNKDELLKDKQTLTVVLKGLLVQFSSIEAKNLVPLRLAVALSSEQLDFEEVNGRIKVNSATIVQMNLRAEDGTAHGIDTVLLPKDLAEQESRADESKAGGNGALGSVKHHLHLVRKKIVGGE
jgi:uncharacterized surface protein with fasciclin (FAS1) repeats